MQKTARGRWAEQLVVDELVARGKQIRDQNWTIPGGEIDIVVQDGDRIVFIEVRSVDQTDDLMEYVTPKKLGHLKRSIEHRIHDHHWTGAQQLDVVFVKGKTIIEWYENVTNN